VRHLKTVPLHGVKAAGRVALVDDEDYELVMQRRWWVLESRRPSGSMAGPYAYFGTGSSRRRDRVFTFMHRLILPGVPEIDHKDGDGLNNQRSNLRPATRTQNNANGPKRRTHAGRPTSSRFKGVSWNKHGRKWTAQIKDGDRMHYLGIFAEEIDAALAYDRAARDVFGEFARLNFPEKAA
jgi:hypothetical protein